jgi:threonine aldolase
MQAIDLRSDTVTQPDAGMREAMEEAPLGDDVFGDDPTINQLEAEVAELLGKESAVFVPSGTMANTIAIAIAAPPGAEMILEASAHTLNFEVAGAARLWGVQAHPIQGDGGVIPLEEIAAAIRPSNVHIPRTAMIILEQTSNLSGGRVLPLDYLQDVARLKNERGLHLHIDGARLFNAAVAAGVSPRDYASCADTVMFCFSKGLGAPAGSILVGPKALIDEGRRVRKMLGGGLRQSGILAACGLYGLKHNVDRLADDHARAAALAEAVRSKNFPGIRVDPSETNMVYVRFESNAPISSADLVAALQTQGLLAVALGQAVRFVFHKDVSAAAAEDACERVTAVLEKQLS